MSAVRNNALLDKLAGDTTIRLEGTHLNPFENGKSFWLLGGSAELGYQEFAYLDADKSFVNPADPKKIEDHDTSYKLTMYGGFSPTDFNDLFLLRYSRQYSHKGQSSVAICPPAASGAPYVVCPAGVLGAPEGKKFNIVSAEWRHRFKSFAVSGTLSYDRTSKVRALAIPVYVSLANRKGGVFGADMLPLSAGVQFGWRSDTKASFGVFAGVPFSMVKSD